jgi:hypothetical protein
LKQKSASANEWLEAADLYNQLKAKRKKSSASLADVELILYHFFKYVIEIKNVKSKTIR